MGAWDADRLVAEVTRLSLRGLRRDEFHQELAARTRRAVPVDATCWHGLDPRTLMLTSADPVELLAGGFITMESQPAAASAVLASEYARDDYNTFASIARRRTPVGVLGESTRGHPERSARCRCRPWQPSRAGSRAASPIGRLRPWTSPPGPAGSRCTRPSPTGPHPTWSRS